MQRVELGRTGLKVSVMGLGAGGDSRLGLPAGDEARSVRLVRTALEHGVDFIDTAEAYGTEEVVGKAIEGVRRDRVVISTKKTTFTPERVEPADVARSLEASLRRLGTDYVDVYHLHGVRPDTYVDLRERLLPTLLRLREQGKIRHLGITEAFAADPTHRTLDLALADDVFDVVMVGFNVLNQSARETVFPRSIAQRVGTLIMFAVRRALSRPDRLRELLQDLAARGKISRELAETGLEFLVGDNVATSLPDAAYRFCRDEPGAHVVLSGTSDEQHLLENVRALERPALPREIRERVVELFRHVDDVSGH
ncbi:MAG TPA: aldo/keto reductase [Polyangiales bacterium]|nr:aldo/keto reductase [Polyangiales bacterium]